MTNLHSSSRSPHSFESPAFESPAFEDVVRERLTRRGALQALLVLGGGAAATLATQGTAQAKGFKLGELSFDPLPLGNADMVSLASGFKHDIIISWGDPVVPGAPAFDVDQQSATAQAQQFGFNNDYIDYLPLSDRPGRPQRGLLFVNHEYTSANMMFPGVTASFPNPTGPVTTAEQKRIEIEAHGASVIEVALNGNTWSYDPSSTYNRRITGSTPMLITGPVAGNVHMRTSLDLTGTQVLGMLNNCGGGSTPWGNVLTAEENFDQYFSNRGRPATATVAATGLFLDAVNETNAVVKALKQYAASNASVFGIPTGASGRGWESVDIRFDLRTEWNEAFRFGWIVEVDPYDPMSTPKKRTALGRFKHEAAAGVTAADGRYVVYMGDDQSAQFIYKFVSSAPVNTTDRSANDSLLDSGTLYVATFLADGTGTWKPIVFGTGPLTAPTFEDQADVLIRTRTAAALQGGTPMDRPEDVEVSPTSGYIYAAMTGTSRSTADAANPRRSNAATDPDSSRGGHIIEMRETNGDHTGTTFSWEIFMLCGNPGASGALDAPTVPEPANGSGRTYFAGFDESQVSPIARPDNLAFDSLGNLWISTDGMPNAASGGGLEKNDTFYGVPTAGLERGHLKALCSVPLGAEATGPYFTADDTTLFGAVQHPGEDGTNVLPQSRWNSISSSVVAGSVISRNGVIAIRRTNGQSIPAGNGPASAAAKLKAPKGSAAIVALGGLVGFRHHRMSAQLDPSKD